MAMASVDQVAAGGLARRTRPLSAARGARDLIRGGEEEEEVACVWKGKAGGKGAGRESA